ncbi:valyl-tRNA synthetase [Cutibacterium acnes JCM 18920]|nr:valyl-tRNA synthetase [Cutibacterium acnes JCM 18920]
MSDAPTLWDVTFSTAVAQAELEARDYPGAYHRLGFHRPNGEDVFIETTRPELLAACCASSLTPTTSAISTSSAPPSPLRCTESRCRCWPTRLRDGQGCRHRHVLYLR